VAVAEMSGDILPRRLKLIINLFCIRALQEYLNFHNKSKKCTCAKCIGN